MVEAVNDARAAAGRIEKSTLVRRTVQKKKTTKHVMIENLHVCNAAILLVFEICRQEVYVERIDVAAPSSSQHLLEGAIAIAVTFECKDLKSRRGGENERRNDYPNVDMEWMGRPVPCPDYP